MSFSLQRYYTNLTLKLFFDMPQKLIGVVKGSFCNLFRSWLRYMPGFFKLSIISLVRIRHSQLNSKYNLWVYLLFWHFKLNIRKEHLLRWIFLVQADNFFLSSAWAKCSRVIVFDFFYLFPNTLLLGKIKSNIWLWGSSDHFGMNLL